MSLYSCSRLNLDRHGKNDSHHTFESEIYFFGEDICALSYLAWERKTEELLQPFFDR